MIKKEMVRKVMRMDMESLENKQNAEELIHRIFKMEGFETVGKTFDAASLTTIFFSTKQANHISYNMSDFENVNVEGVWVFPEDLTQHKSMLPRFTQCLGTETKKSCQ